jgi:hypothetical protein
MNPQSVATKRPALQWFVSGLLGIPVGAILIILPFPGLVIAGLVLAWGMGQSPRLPAVSGILFSSGLVYLALLWSAFARCSATSQSADTGCVSSTDPFIYALLASGLAVTGLILALAHLSRSARSSRGGST